MIRILWVVIFALLPINLTQSTDDMARDINKAIGQGNARNMAKHFGPNVELFIPLSEGTFSKSQSEVILRDFFTKNLPDTFAIHHQGSSRDGSLYVIGTLKTKDGTFYRTYYLIKKVSQTYFLHQLQIEAR